MLGKYWQRLPQFKSQQGLSLLEVLLVMLIAAILIILSVRFYAGTRQAQAVNAGVTQIQQIVQAASKSSQYRPTTSLTIDDLINDNLIPQSYNKNPWGGKAVLMMSYMPNNMAQGLVANVQFYNVPKSACLQLMQRVLLTMTQTDLEFMKSFGTDDQCKKQSSPTFTFQVL
ncbi:MAG: hypothetical protein CMF50_09575 [Legionellales bacterium]|nr:hypothetical protein [Legionellales bacterium]|tara:strand:- start:7746 stop:8258 length:513 start_codon:yes stop_codon:yes gene_type:complete